MRGSTSCTILSNSCCRNERGTSLGDAPGEVTGGGERRRKECSGLTRCCVLNDGESIGAGRRSCGVGDGAARGRPRPPAGPTPAEPGGMLRLRGMPASVTLSVTLRLVISRLPASTDMAVRDRIRGAPPVGAEVNAPAPPRCISLPG